MLKEITSQLSLKLNQLRQGDGLKTRMARGSIWVAIGFGGSTAFRMISSLALTRLLAPEIFGLVALLSSVIAGITLLSEIGVSTSVIQNPRGEEPAFLKTAWTLQAIRGVILWIISIIAAWPAALLYDEPQLLWMIPTAGIALIIKGVTSTSLYLHMRKMWTGPVIKLELASQAIGIAATIGLALLWHNAWAIIIGGLIGVTVKMIGTHLYLPGGVNGFHWDRQIVQTIIRFGRWIFVATMMTFLVGQGDRLILGAFMTQTTLGLYNLAAMFSQLSMSILYALMEKTIMPAMVEIGTVQRDELSIKINKLRLYLLAILLPPITLGAIIGQYLIEFLYDPRYYEAGWMLQLLSVGVIPQVIGLSVSPVFLAKGDSFRHMINIGSWALILISSMLIGAYLIPETGLIYGITLAPFIWLPLSSWLVRKYITVDHRITFLAFAFSGSLIALGWWLFGINIP